jgi:hypothetical protein
MGARVVVVAERKDQGTVCTSSQLRAGGFHQAVCAGFLASTSKLLILPKMAVIRVSFAPRFAD